MLSPHDIRIDADVFSSDGEKLGQLSRVVLDRATLKITSVVVDIGFLRSGRPLWAGGLGLDYDRVVPVDAVASAGEERVTLTLTAPQFKDTPAYSDDHFERPYDVTPGVIDYNDTVAEAATIADAIAAAPNVWIVPKLNKTRDESEIGAGTPVWRQEPHEKVGEVDRVLSDPATGRAVALVVKRGFLLKRDVVLPVRYITELLDDIVRVELTDAQLDALQDYVPDAPTP